MTKTSRVVHRNSKSHVEGICQKGDSKNDEVAGMYITYMSDTCGDVPGKLFPFKNNNYCVMCLVVLFSDTPGYESCTKQNLSQADKKHLSQTITDLRSAMEKIYMQITQLEKMKICGWKANAKITYGWRRYKSNDRLQRFTEHWYCKFHTEEMLKEAFANNKVTVNYPLVTEQKVESMQDHLKNRANDDYYAKLGGYEIGYKSRWF